LALTFASSPEPEMRQPVHRTKTGKVLTDAEIEAMADEAECGYDVEVLKTRRRGSRPASAPPT
jgi:hypothetical protein